MKKVIVLSLLILGFVFAISGTSFAQWQTDVRLTNDTAISYTNYNFTWSVVASGDFVHVVWRDERDGNKEIYYKRSTDAGITWGADTRLTNAAGNSWYPSIAVNGPTIHVVWEDFRDGNDEIYYKLSTDAGISWGTDTRLTNDTNWSWSPSISVSGQDVHIVWQEYRDGNPEIYYKRSTNGGISWGEDTRLTENTVSSSYASLAVSGSIVHVAWFDNRDLNRETYYKRSTDAGITWGADSRLTNNTSVSGYPSIAASSQVVHIVWSDRRDGNLEIYYKRSTDGGITWEADSRLTNSWDPRHRDYSWQPSLAVSESAVHIVWNNNRDRVEEIYYKRSINAGESWEEETRLTNNSAPSRNPSVSVSGSAVHTVWTDNRDGNWEIYYKRDPTGNLYVPAVTVFEDNSENGFGNWTTNQGWNTIAKYPKSPVNSFTDSPSGNYSNNANNSMELKVALNVSDYNNLVLSFWHRYATQSGKDFCRVEVSSNNGTSWVQVSSYSGTLSTLTQTEFDISIYKSPSLKIRFRLTSDKSVAADGWYIDDIRITGKTSGAQITKAGKDNNLPENYSLSQNYPNPFNPITKIKFDVVLVGDVKIVVYDVMGREIQTLVNESLQPGSFEVTFDATNYPSGIYFYRITTDAFIETKKMMLLR